MKILEALRNKPRGGERPELPPNVVQLAELAKGTAREGYPALVTYSFDDCCEACGDTSIPLAPLRSQHGSLTHCFLACKACFQRPEQSSIRALNGGPLEEALIVESNMRLRVITGEGLETEVLS